MKENNHVHTADYIGQEHSSVLGGGEGREQAGFHAHESPTKTPVANDTTWDSSKNFIHQPYPQENFVLFWVTTILGALAMYLSLHLGQETGNNMNPHTFLNVYYYYENGKNQVSSLVNHIPNQNLT